MKNKVNYIILVWVFYTWKYRADFRNKREALAYMNKLINNGNSRIRLLKQTEEVILEIDSRTRKDKKKLRNVV
jgi:hypothetical protein